jgi:hypothetical protein
MRNVKSNVPVGMTVPEYRRTFGRPKRQSAIRRFVGYGLLR